MFRSSCSHLERAWVITRTLNKGFLVFLLVESPRLVCTMDQNQIEAIASMKSGRQNASRPFCPAAMASSFEPAPKIKCLLFS